MKIQFSWLIGLIISVSSAWANHPLIVSNMAHTLASPKYFFSKFLQESLQNYGSPEPVWINGNGSLFLKGHKNVMGSGVWGTENVVNDEFYIFVIDRAGECWAQKPGGMNPEYLSLDSKPNHFYLSRGEEVLLAGQFVVRNGKVKVISGFSEEYISDQENLIRLVRFLNEKNALELHNVWVTMSDLYRDLGTRIKMTPFAETLPYVLKRHEDYLDTRNRFNTYRDAYMGIQEDYFCKNLVKNKG